MNIHPRSSWPWTFSSDGSQGALCHPMSVGPSLLFYSFLSSRPCPERKSPPVSPRDSSTLLQAPSHPTCPAHSQGEASPSRSSPPPPLATSLMPWSCLPLSSLSRAELLCNHSLLASSHGPSGGEIEESKMSSQREQNACEGVAGEFSPSCVAKFFPGEHPPTPFFAFSVITSTRNSIREILFSMISPSAFFFVSALPHGMPDVPRSGIKSTPQQ